MRQKLAMVGPPPYIGVTWRAGTKGSDLVLYKESPMEPLAHLLRDIPATVLILQRHPRPASLNASPRNWDGRRTTSAHSTRIWNRCSRCFHCWTTTWAHPTPTCTCAPASAGPRGYWCRCRRSGAGWRKEGIAVVSGIQGVSAGI